MQGSIPSAAVSGGAVKLTGSREVPSPIGDLELLGFSVGKGGHWKKEILPNTPFPVEHPPKAVLHGLLKDELMEVLPVICG